MQCCGPPTEAKQVNALHSPASSSRQVLFENKEEPHGEETNGEEGGHSGCRRLRAGGTDGTEESFGRGWSDHRDCIPRRQRSAGVEPRRESGFISSRYAPEPGAL